MVILFTVVVSASSIAVLFWLWTTYQSQQYIKTLISQGADGANLNRSMSDEVAYIKKDIQNNPDMKVRIRIFVGRIYLIFIDTNLIKEILTNQPLYNKLVDKSGLEDQFSKNRLVTSEGRIWKLHRKVISVLSKYDFFHDMVPTIAETTDDILNISSPTKKTIQLPHDIEGITSDAITGIFFGVKSNDVMIDGCKASDQVNNIYRGSSAFYTSKVNLLLGTWALNIFPSFRKQKERIREFRRVFGEKIHKRMSQLERGTSDTSNEPRRRRDLLQIILEHRLANNNNVTETLSDDDILDEFITFFRAGKDTTALLISMCLYCVVKYPQWGDKLRKEIDDTLKDHKSPSLELINSMNVISAFVNEVLRMYSSAPDMLIREANEDHYVGKFFVKKGTMVNVLFMANSYNPKFFDEPEKFDPSRFLNTSETPEKWKMDPYAYLPFSAGQRGCIAKHLALIETKTVLSVILKHYSISIDPSLELKMDLLVVGYGPVDPIPLDLTPR